MYGDISRDSGEALIYKGAEGVRTIILILTITFESAVWQVTMESTGIDFVPISQAKGQSVILRVLTLWRLTT